MTFLLGLVSGLFLGVLVFCALLAVFVSLKIGKTGYELLANEKKVSHVFSPPKAKFMELAEIDRAETLRENEEKGVGTNIDDILNQEME